MWTAAGRHFPAAPIWSPPSSSRSRLWAGPHRNSALPRPWAAGPGLCSSPTPSSGLPGHWPNTSADRGRNTPRPTGSPRPGCAGVQEHPRSPHLPDPCSQTSWRRSRTATRRQEQTRGTQQQRVAIAPALAAENPLFLLDEPFAALDALTRERLQDDLRRVADQTGRTTVFVTHSPDEAVFLASRIVVLTKRPGTIALELPVPLPRGDIDPEELRGSTEFAEARAQVAHAVKSAAA